MRVHCLACEHQVNLLNCWLVTDVSMCCVYLPLIMQPPKQHAPSMSPS
jgi:hypothetical protein